MSKLKCTVCCKESKEVNSWVYCPKAEGEICMRHCIKCSYLDDRTSWIHCRYKEQRKREKRA